MSALKSVTRDSLSYKDFTTRTEENIELTLYGETIKCASSNILPYNPQSKQIYNENYQVKSLIYSNGLSPTIISLAENLENNRLVAIKELRKDRLNKNFLNEFAKNELTIHYSLSRISNNIVNVLDYFEDDFSYILAMEYCEEPNYFDDILENRYCPISNERTLKAYCLDILNGLNEIHKNNIIHCDIKPQNFLIFKNEMDLSVEYTESENENNSIDSFDPNVFLKITDFGLSHPIPLGSNKTFMKFRCGTHYYTAPEIKNDCHVDQSIDMWSFGVSLYQMAVAYFPTAIKQYKYGSGPIPFRAQDWKDFDFPKLKTLIEGCLQIEPAKRLTARDALNHEWFEV